MPAYSFEAIDQQGQPRKGVLEADTARERYKKLYVRFHEQPARIDFTGLKIIRQEGREIQLLVNGDCDQTIERLKTHSPESIRTEPPSLEEIFVTSLSAKGTDQ